MRSAFSPHSASTSACGIFVDTSTTTFRPVPEIKDMIRANCTREVSKSSALFSSSDTLLIFGKTVMIERGEWEVFLVFFSFLLHSTARALDSHAIGIRPAQFINISLCHISWHFQHSSHASRWIRQRDVCQYSTRRVNYLCHCVIIIPASKCCKHGLFLFFRFSAHFWKNRRLCSENNKRGLPLFFSFFIFFPSFFSTPSKVF